MLKREADLLHRLLSAIRRRRGRIGSVRPLIWMDLGLHKEALQIRRVLSWFPDATIYGFEANPEYFDECRRRFAGNPRVHLFNAAVVGPSHRRETISLHIGGKREGLGDSIYRKGRHNAVIDVPAVRLSDFIRRHGIDNSNASIMLRMNIEGAELDVLRDLVESDLAERISGWFGLWNDCAKVDGKLGVELEAIKASAGIDNISFNDRDSKGRYASLKESLIRYEIATAAMPMPSPQAANSLP